MSRIELMRAQYEAWNRRDLEELRTRIGEDFVWSPNPDDPEQDVARGREETERRLRELWDFLPDLRTEVETMEEHGDRVLASVRHFARSSESDAFFDRREVQAWTFRGEELVALDEFPDLESARQALGLAGS